MTKKIFNFFFVLLFCFLVVFVVIRKQKNIEKKQSKPIVSFYAEYEKEGKPVSVKKVRFSDLESKLKMTISCGEKQRFYAYVSKDVLDRLKNNMSISFFSNNQEITGRIDTLKKSLDKDVCLYKVEGKLLKDCSGLNYIAHVLSVDKKAFIIPQEAVFFEKEKAFVWTVKENVCLKKEILNPTQEKDFFIVKEGVLAGDLIVVKGARELLENDKVYITNLGENND